MLLKRLEREAVLADDPLADFSDEDVVDMFLSASAEMRRRGINLQ
jgi:hypothetical protein